MEAFIDYYDVLGIEFGASPEAIKAAFKKLALRYHPDVYKGDDAHERMRLLLLAYQTLNDPETRRQYNARRSEHFFDGATLRPPQGMPPRPAGGPAQGGRPYAGSGSAGGSFKRTGSDVSPGARRDRQRRYAFPDFRDGQPMRIDLVDIAYTLTANEARSLVHNGLLRGSLPESKPQTHFCHRCHYSWQAGPSQGRNAPWNVPHFCPKCQARDWFEYLLLRCVHCCAVFESEQIRYEIGQYSYGKTAKAPELCPPYELFPLCPYCGTARWCPSEDERVEVLRQRAQRRWRWPW
ncbi:MAG TPA: DnaJ domain-containing protein [Ktedonosporobacter sp.]|nr:DnaJ domain-containing protein [Ktedonosporobacter sp.]